MLTAAIQSRIRNGLVITAGGQAIRLGRWSQSVLLGEVQGLTASPATKRKRTQLSNRSARQDALTEDPEEVRKSDRRPR